MDHSNTFIYKYTPSSFGLEEKTSPVRKTTYAPFTGTKARGAELHNQKNLIMVRFLFSSFIASDVQYAKSVFHTCVMKLSHLLNKRIWNQHTKQDSPNKSIQPLILQHQTGQKRAENLEAVSKNDQNRGKDISHLKMWLGSQIYSTNTVWEMKSDHIIKTIHRLGSLKAANQLPQSTRLRTVIRSPHVFKKTREQFGMTKYKISLDYYFKSHRGAQLFINCACLVKFPLEVQIILSSGK